MMPLTKPRLKLLLWLLGGVLLLAGGVWTVRSAGGWVVATGSGADPAEALNLPPDIPSGGRASLQWQPDAVDTGREMEPYTRRQIEAAYLRAWRQWNLALAHGDPAGLGTYFAGPGLTAAKDGIAAMAGSGYRVEQRNEAHTLRLHLYAADGSIVSFSDERAEIVQDFRDDAGQTVFVERHSAQIDVVMFLEDGNWRIRHWVRR